MGKRSLTYTNYLLIITGRAIAEINSDNEVTIVSEKEEYLADLKLTVIDKSKSPIK